VGINERRYGSKLMRCGNKQKTLLSQYGIARPYNYIIIQK
jgi:hypothetical protein